MSAGLFLPVAAAGTFTLTGSTEAGGVCCVVEDRVFGVDRIFSVGGVDNGTCCAIDAEVSTSLLIDVGTEGPLGGEANVS